jgi:uncharacterized protein YbaR (Trm112 family)
MRASLLDTLRCPFCGTRFDLIENEALRRTGDTIDAAVLGCQCCAFPVVDGIPVLIADDTARTAMHLMETGRHDDALAAMLGLDEGRSTALRTLLRRTTPATYREALEIISPDAEGTYFVFRFSDPTFIMAEGLLGAITCVPAQTTRIIDVCGGSGHLTRGLTQASERPVVLADVFFWKLWLAARFVSPGCEPVCCDANHPLPFTSGIFSMVVLSDAFPYIWHKRLLADEMMRLAASNGTIVMPHLHSSLGFNFSAGMTLTPAAYQDLLAPRGARLFADGPLLDGILDRGELDLSGSVAADSLDEAPSVTLVASGNLDVFGRHRVAARLDVTGELRVNPLYTVEQRGPAAYLTLTFPTPEYEEEFGGSRRYLSDSLTLTADLTGPLSPEMFGDRYRELRNRRILIDAPRHYV